MQGLGEIYSSEARHWLTSLVLEELGKGKPVRAESLSLYALLEHLKRGFKATRHLKTKQLPLILVRTILRGWRWLGLLATLWGQLG